MLYKKIDKIFKISLLCLFVASIFLANIYFVEATTVTKGTTTANVYLRKGPGTSYGTYTTVPKGTTLTLKSSKSDTGGCDGEVWYYVTYGSYSGYVCSVLISDIVTSEVTEVTSDMASMTDEEFDAYLDSQGFPESYKTKLKTLHASHPNWVFVGVEGRYTWSTALSKENTKGYNLYQSTSTSTQGYLSTADGDYNWYTDTFIAKEGSSWYQASSDTIAYYMDPRNFLTESGIFMFEDLNYYSEYQTSSAVSKVLYSSFYTNLITYYMTAAETYDVSPIYLAALSRQEVGLSSSYATSGTTSSYCSVDYTGYYNFYNIGANTGVCDGLAYAKKVGWSSKKKAIVGGASVIVANYISKGQNTPYFQKFNLSSNSTATFPHQYMANVRAVASSAATTYSSYNSMDILDYPIVFQIPIYSGMPSSTSLPSTGNPNNYLKTLTVDGTSVSNFDGSTTSYTVTVPSSTTSVKLAATTVNSNATISGTGTISISSSSKTVSVVVTAQNGNTKTYKVTIKRAGNTSTDSSSDDEAVLLTPAETVKGAGYKISSSYVYNVTLGSTISGMTNKLANTNPYASINFKDSSGNTKTSGSLGTGDKVIITSNNSTITYTVIIYGDVSGDGQINTLDLLKIQKHILKKSTLSGAYLKAADTSKDGNVNTLDLLKVQKHILKISNISQS